MTTNPNSQSPSGGNSASEKVTLVSVREPKSLEDGTVYVEAYFKRGVFGKPVRRSFWGKTDDNDLIVWERLNPDELKPLVGQDLTGEVFIHPIEIEEKEITNKVTGESYSITNSVVVRFSDETLEQACRRYGVEPKRMNTAASDAPSTPPGFVTIPTNGAHAG